MLQMYKINIRILILYKEIIPATHHSYIHNYRKTNNISIHVHFYFK